LQSGENPVYPIHISIFGNLFRKKNLIIYKNDVPAKSEPKLLCFNKRDGNLIFKYDIIFPSIIFGYKDDKIIFEYRYLIGLNEYYFDNGFAYKIELDKLINDIK